MKPPTTFVRSHKRSAVVVGAGPAGLLAAQMLAEAGLNVAVYDHKPTVGRKLLLAGRGGLNITNNEPLDPLIGRYGVAAHRLDAAVRAFPPSAVRAWCAELGEETFVGPTGRVFPASFRATPLLRTLLARLETLGVSIHVRMRWTGWDGSACTFTVGDGTVRTVESDVTVLALGGASWPRVGSDGSWAEAIRRDGIRVNAFRPANCGIHLPWSEQFADRHVGTPLKNVALRVGDHVVRGDAVVVPAGLEGGPVYTQSALIRDAIERNGSCPITVDLQPDLTVGEIAQRLQRRRPSDSFSSGLRRALSLTPVAVALIREATGPSIPSDTAELAAILKAVPFTVTATASLDRAISSAGGVALDEVDEAFMLHRRPGTYVVGEMLDWEAPTGGYLLQATLSTAAAAANGAIRRLGLTPTRGPQ